MVFNHVWKLFLSADFYKNRPIFSWHTTDFCRPTISADFYLPCVMGFSCQLIPETFTFSYYELIVSLHVYFSNSLFIGNNDVCCCRQEILVHLCGLVLLQLLHRCHRHISFTSETQHCVSVMSPVCRSMMWTVTHRVWCGLCHLCVGAWWTDRAVEAQSNG